MTDTPITPQAPLPPGIGPHEGRELDLMLAGAKPMAMFYDAVQCSDHLPDADFAPHVANGTILRHEEIILVLSHPEKHKIRYLLFALPGEEWRIADAMEMNRNLCAGTVACHETDARRMGELLGYPPEDIDQFISRTFNSQPA